MKATTFQTLHVMDKVYILTLQTLKELMKNKTDYIKRLGCKKLYKIQMKKKIN